MDWSTTVRDAYSTADRMEYPISIMDTFVLSSWTIQQQLGMYVYSTVERLNYSTPVGTAYSTAYRVVLSSVLKGQGHEI